MKAFYLISALSVGLLASPVFAAEKAEPAVAKDKTSAVPASAPAEEAAPATPPPPGEPPPEEDEALGVEKTRVRAVPEGWIPNYRFPKKAESDLFSINVGGNLLWPQGSFNVLVAKRVTVGLMAFYFDYKFEGVQSKHTGGLLTVSAYSKDDLEGLWVFAGLGASQAKSAFLDGRASGTQPAAILSAAVGRRWKFSHFNTGISVGAMYFEQIFVSTFRYRLGVLYPAVIYDIGFSW